MTQETYFIKTFGCQANTADSERIERALQGRGMVAAVSENEATYLVINTCMVRESAENRVYGLLNNLGKQRQRTGIPHKIVVTGCMVGGAVREKTGKAMRALRRRMPEVDEFLPIDEVGFDYIPLRGSKQHAWVPISQGCNNFCSFCIVPFTRGVEISRPYAALIEECQALQTDGYTTITLLGQNVNSYGADLVRAETLQSGSFQIDDKRFVQPIVVKHLGRQRIPTLFPYLLADVAQMGFTSVDFMSSNPWDFSPELIEVIKIHPNISRMLHLPVQSGDDAMLKTMSRWYTRDEYLALVCAIRTAIPEVVFTTDIIVGFPGETEQQFENTVALAREVGFDKAFIGIYSPRPFTKSAKDYEDDIPQEEKRRRWRVLDELINMKGQARHPSEVVIE